MLISRLYKSIIADTYLLSCPYGNTSFAVCTRSQMNFLASKTLKTRDAMKENSVGTEIPTALLMQSSFF
jgi:hypothetical protein